MTGHRAPLPVGGALRGADRAELELPRRWSRTSPRRAAPRRRQDRRLRRILAKPGPLDRLRVARDATTPWIGAAILEDAGLDEIREWILCHHERPDGRATRAGCATTRSRSRRDPGRCGRLRGDDERPVYRRAIGRERARAELRRNAGAQFDEVVVEAFLRVSSTPGREIARPANLARGGNLGGASRARTGDLRTASHALSQLSYSPRAHIARPILDPRSDCFGTGPPEDEMYVWPATSEIGQEIAPCQGCDSKQRLHRLRPRCRWSGHSPSVCTVR